MHNYSGGDQLIILGVIIPGAVRDVYLVTINIIRDA